jgi:hypothetical protein
MVLSADDSLLAHAKILSEGMAETAQGGHHRFAGSTMLSIDLADPRFDIPHTNVARQTVAEAASRSVLLRAKILRLARAEAERRAAPLLLSTMSANARFALEGTVLRIDVDVQSAAEDPREQLAEGMRPGEE